jgi:inner membrane protein
MASLFGHGIVAFTIAKVVDVKVSKIIIVLAIISSILPDADVLAFKMGIPYEHPFGHRGFTHSILFATVWAILISVFFKTKKKLVFVVITLSTISHGVLDALTTGGRGVGFFIPFSNERFFFPFRFIKVSPLSIEKFFSSWGLQVLLNEFIFIGIPCAIVLIALYFSKKRTS